MGKHIDLLEQKLKMYKDQIEEWKDAYDCKTKVHNKLNLDYIELQQGIVEQQEEIDRLKQENEKLKECVKFYGDEDNYMDAYYGNYVHVDEGDQETCGKRARAVLKELEED